jgi:CBS domain-containing protein
MFGHVSTVIAEKGKQVYVVAPGTTVRAAVRDMNDHGVGALVVAERGVPVGIFSERDVLRRVVDKGLDPETTRVRAVMTRDLIVVRPETRVDEAMELMTRHRVRHLPVVEHGKLDGMISIGDLLRRVTMLQEAEIDHLVDYITGRHPA